MFVVWFEKGCYMYSTKKETVLVSIGHQERRDLTARSTRAAQYVQGFSTAFIKTHLF